MLQQCLRISCVLVCAVSLHAGILSAATNADIRFWLNQLVSKSPLARSHAALCLQGIAQQQASPLVIYEVLLVARHHTQLRAQQYEDARSNPESTQIASTQQDEGSLEAKARLEVNQTLAKLAPRDRRVLEFFLYILVDGYKYLTAAEGEQAYEFVRKHSVLTVPLLKYKINGSNLHEAIRCAEILINLNRTPELYLADVRALTERIPIDDLEHWAEFSALFTNSYPHSDKFRDAALVQAFRRSLQYTRDYLLMTPGLSLLMQMRAYFNLHTDKSQALRLLDSFVLAAHRQNLPELVSELKAERSYQQISRWSSVEEEARHFIDEAILSAKLFYSQQDAKETVEDLIQRLEQIPPLDRPRIAGRLVAAYMNSRTQQNRQIARSMVGSLWEKGGIWRLVLADSPNCTRLLVKMKRIPSPPVVEPQPRQREMDVFEHQMQRKEEK